MESLEERINNSKEIERSGFLKKIIRNKWLRRTVLPFAFPIIFGTNGCGDGDEENKSPTFPVTPPIVETKPTDTKTTDRRGEISFVNNETGRKINIHVIDKQSKQGLKNAAISYFRGEGYNVFLAAHDSYLPFRKVYSDAKEIEGLLEDIFTLVDRTQENKTFLQRLKEKEEIAALTNWEYDNFMITEESYLMTVDKEEKLRVDEINDLAVSIAGIVGETFDGSLTADQFESLVDIGNAFFLPERQIDAPRWDVYKIIHRYTNISGTVVPIYKFIPSNVPTLTVDEPKINGNNVNLKWKGEDKTEYAQPFGLLSRKDPTILFGETEDSDLKYIYTVKESGDIVLQDSTSKTQVSLSGLEDGNYNLEVLVRDEVGNESELKTKAFLIGRTLLNKIAFSSRREGHKEIYLMDSDGSNIRKLINSTILLPGSSSIALSPLSISWSPNGIEIACANYENYILIFNSANGKLLKAIEPRVPPRSIDWSPAWREIVFSVSTGNGKYDGFYLLDIDRNTSMKYDLDFTNLNSNGSIASWSSDGSQILFSSKGQIYIMDRNGDNVKELTLKGGLFPVMSPLGNKIAFTSYRDGNSEIYIMDTNGDNQTRLTFNSFPKIEPSWSPDGSKIAFTSWRNEDNYDNYDIYVINSDGTNETRLTRHPAMDLNPAWSPR